MRPASSPVLPWATADRDNVLPIPRHALAPLDAWLVAWLVDGAGVHETDQGVVGPFDSAGRELDQEPLAGELHLAGGAAVQGADVEGLAGPVLDPDRRQ